MKTSADFLRRLAALPSTVSLSAYERERLREIAQEIDAEQEREANESIAELRARVEALEAAQNRPAPASSPPPEFSLPPVDPLEAIKPTYRPDVPPSPPAQEGL